jgi:hypothetical protein
MKRIIALILSFGLLVPPVFSEQADRIFTMRDFSKALSTNPTEYVLKENQAIKFQNLRTNERHGGIAKRPVNRKYGSIGAFAVTGLHRYYKASGAKYLIANGSTKAFLGNDTTGAFTELGTGYSDGLRWEWVTYKDMAIGMNGTNGPIKWDGNSLTTANTDGARTAGDSVTQLGAPFAELNTGTDLDANSWYQYKIVYYDGSIYYHSTARSNPILTGGTVHNITLTDIPVGPAGITHRYVYRTLGAASRAAVIADTTYYLVATIANNTATTHNDSMGDTTADDDAAPTYATASAGINITPPTGKYPLIHKEKLFISGNVTYPSDVYWSENFLPDFFNPEDYEAVRQDDGDDVTFLKQFLGILTIGKTNTIQRFYTDGAVSNWTLSPPMSFVGCPAPYSAVSTPIGIIYLSRDGIYSFTGQGSQLISDIVTPTVKDISPANLDKATGYFYKNEYLLSYASQSVGGASNNRVLLYDLSRDAYALDTKAINVFAAFNASDDLGILYHGASSTTGNVFADSGTDSALYARYLSDFNLGTFNDARVIGDEASPVLEIAWTLTIDQGVGDIDTGYPTSIIDRPDTDGTWTSPAYNISSSSLDQIQWNELLNNFGNVTFQVRTAATEAGISSAVWSSAVTTPTGSDISGTTGLNWIQVRANLSTSDITVTPNLYSRENYVWRLFYSLSGATKESAYSSEWETGWLNFGAEGQGHKKTLRRFRVYYEGTEGELTMTYKNDEGNVTRNFTIDLSVLPSTSADDEYTGTDTYKVFTTRPSENTEADPYPVGELWKYNFSENGTNDWKVYAIETLYSLDEIFN